MPEFPIKKCCLRTADECDCDLRKRDEADLLSRLATQKRFELTDAALNTEQAFQRHIETVHRDMVEIERRAGLVLNTGSRINAEGYYHSLLAIARRHILKPPVDPLALKLARMISTAKPGDDATKFADELRADFNITPKGEA